jgi:hypothetical protein
MKNLQFPEQDYQQLVALAKQAGFRVSRGRGSQLRLFVMAAANNACTLMGGILPPEKPLSTSKQLSRSQKLSKPATHR